MVQSYFLDISNEATSSLLSLFSFAMVPMVSSNTVIRTLNNHGG